MNNVKTCVYTVSLNEIKHVTRFMKACKDADLVVICDTGSTDGTPEKFEELGAKVYQISQKPWRFDIPRNTCLNLVPNDIDICLSIDVDEILQPGWWDALNKQWHHTEGKMTKVSYDYIWNWKEDKKTPDVRFFTQKIHARHGYAWKDPCHETLYWTMEDSDEYMVTIPELSVHHRADDTKSRGQYLGLLKTATKESPENDRMAFYYARELFFYSKLEESAKEFKRYLSLETSIWDRERAAAFRYLSKIESDKKEYWLKKAIEECPEYKEALIELSYRYYELQKYDMCYIYAKQAIDSPIDYSYLSESFTSTDLVYDLASIAAYNLGIKNKAIEYAEIGVKINPQNARLLSNLSEFKKNLTQF